MVDIITERVVTNYLFTVAEEMGIITMRTARSNVIKEGGDFSTALYDWKGRLAQHGRDMPAHQGLFPVLIKQALEKIDLLSVKPGDVFITNTEDVAGSHLNDVKVFAPVFYQDEIVMWAANLSHWPDVGGSVPGSYYGQATEIYQEGLQIPLIKIAKNGELREDVTNLIMKNVRGSQERIGDLRAQLASINFASVRIEKLFEKYGKETILACFDSLNEYSEYRMREEIKKIPDGTYQFEDFMDDDGVEDRPVRFHAKVTVKGDEVIFDFSGCDKNVKGPINSPYSQTCSAAYFAIRVVTDHSIPPNEGCYSPVKVIAEEGSVVHAPVMAPRVFCTHETSTRLVDVCLGAFYQGIPDKVPAAGCGSSFIMIVGGKDPRNDKHYAWYEPIAGGFGARPGIDGMDGTRVHMGNTANTPVEVFERDYPLVCEQYEYITDTAGAGEYRGGLGVVKRIRGLKVENNAPVVTSVSERNKFAPYGLNGGLPASKGGFGIGTQDGGEKQMPGSCPGKTNYTLSENETWAAYSPGGGGYGDPLNREPKKVLWDVLEEKISIEKASELYGVIIRKETCSIDEKGTMQKRAELKQTQSQK